MKKKILVLGISGLTGYKIVTKSSDKFEVYGTFNSRPVKLDRCISSKLDITNKQKVKELFNEIKPNFVINTTALHNVDFCEENSTRSYQVNTHAVQFLYENSEKHGSKLVHISTDYVFDGKKTTPYSEDDKAIPLSVYGLSKKF